MRKFVISILIFSLIFSFPFSLTSAQSGENREFSLFRVYVKSSDDVLALVNLGLDILGGRDDYRDVLVKENQLSAFYALNLPFEPLVLQAAPAQTTSDYYYSYNTMVSELNSLANSHQNIAKTYIIGYSFQGRPIWAIKITKTPVLENTRPRVLISACHHAREWMTLAVAMKLIHYLSANYNTDDNVRYLVNTRETWIVPLNNPDGYIYDTGGSENPSIPGILWRKNMRDNFQDDGPFSSPLGTPREIAAF